jgi:hypothetical protein
VSPKQPRGSLAGLQPPPAAMPPLPVRPAASVPPAEVQTPVQQSSEVRTPEVQTPEVTEPRSRRRTRGQPAAPALRSPAPGPGLPKYLRLERKELLVWPDQITNLSILARVLNRTRRGAGERITTNTLIRVAVALLLSRSQDLAGTTEEELRRSLGLPDLQTPDLRTSPSARGIDVYISHIDSGGIASGILECMLDKIPAADRILIAQLHGEAQRHARRGEMAEDEHQAAVGEMRKLAGGRADLLAHVCGIELGFGEGEPAETVSLSLRVAALCREAGADESLIPEWVAIGRQRRIDARRLPFSGGLRRRARPSALGRSGAPYPPLVQLCFCSAVHRAATGEWRPPRGAVRRDALRNKSTTSAVARP